MTCPSCDQACERRVPLVALVDDPGEPRIDRPHQVGQLHAGRLGEVPELVRQHARELLEIERRGQGQAHREHQAAAEEREEPVLGTRRGVHLAVDVDPDRRWCADRRADAVDEGEEERLLRRVQRPRLGALAAAGEERLAEEEDQDGEDRERTEVERPARPWRCGRSGRPRGCGSRASTSRSRPGPRCRGRSAGAAPSRRPRSGSRTGTGARDGSAGSRRRRPPGSVRDWRDRVRTAGPRDERPRRRGRRVGRLRRSTGPRRRAAAAASVDAGPLIRGSHKRGRTPSGVGAGRPRSLSSDIPRRSPEALRPCTGPVAGLADHRLTSDMPRARRTFHAGGRKRHSPVLGADCCRRS